MEFCPGIYEHAAALVEQRPWDVSRSQKCMESAHHAAWLRYRHRLVVVGVDVYNIEPEALGATVGEPPGNGVPAIAAHLLEEIEEWADLAPFDPLAGRLPLILGAARNLVASCEGAEVRVPVCGPLALANGILGMENLLMGLAEDPDLAKGALGGLFSYQSAYLRAIQEAGARPIFFESGATPPLLAPAMFEEIEAPLLQALFDEAERIFGERPPCIIGGNAAPIADTLFQTRPGYVIAPSETDQTAFLAAASEYPDVHVRVNMSVTRLASEKWPEVEIEALRALNVAATRGNTSLGCGVVPFETCPELLLRLRDFIQQHE